MPRSAQNVCRRCAAATILAVLGAGSARPVLAAGVHLPYAARHAAPHAPPTVLPPADWSTVLPGVPVPPGARLDFFDGVLDGEVPGPVAWYALDADASGAAADWYRAMLPAFGWWLASDTGAVQRWRRGRQWLEVWPPGVEGVRWLRLVREPGVPARAGDATLDGAVPLPAGGSRRRYDRADLLVEELAFDGSPADVTTRLVDLLASQGWAAEGAFARSDATVTVFARGAEHVLASARGLPGGATELGVGSVDCAAAYERSRGRPERTECPYLDGVPAPPETWIAGYAARAPAGEATERWAGACLDLDDFRRVLASRLAVRGWSLVPGDATRAPGTLHAVAAPPDDAEPITVDARPLSGGGLEVLVARAAAGRRPVAGTSLLFDDLVVPPTADAFSLTTDVTGDWAFDETYVVDAAAAPALDRFFRRGMTDVGWRFDRLEPPGAGPGLVFARAGETVRVDLDRLVEGRAAIGLARRRTCTSDQPEIPAGDGAPARHLAEMPVVPGAAYDGLDAARERYRLECASLDGLVAWYRRAMERGPWVLASTVGPEDPDVRVLLFVRPEERSKPPEARTAWAQVQLARPWPYRFTVTLARDPGGVLPAPEHE
jgi:hypothetical protein